MGFPIGQLNGRFRPTILIGSDLIRKHFFFFYFVETELTELTELIICDSNDIFSQVSYTMYRKLQVITPIKKVF